MTSPHALRTLVQIGLAALALSFGACNRAPEAEAQLMSKDSSIPMLGAEEPLVVVTVFCDYQCPACRMASSQLDTLVSAFDDTVQLRYRQFPLMGMHRLARDAAVYALAAHRQGRFSCMNKILYLRQPEWDELSPEAFREAAADLAVACHADRAQFLSDSEDPELGRQVDDDAEIARTLEERGGTPTIYVNGIKPASPREMPPHARLLIPRIRTEIRQARALIANGVPRADVARQKIFGNTGDLERTKMIFGE